MQGPRIFIVRLARCAARPEKQPDPKESTKEPLAAERDSDRPPLLSRMQELHANGEQDLYA